MTAALSLADQGFAVHLVEKEPELGGNLRALAFSLEGADLARVPVAPDRAGDVASPHLGLPRRRADRDLRPRRQLPEPARDRRRRGVGEPRRDHHRHRRSGARHRPVSARPGRTGDDPARAGSAARLRGLPEELGESPTVVMIQCVGSRTDENPYCSRVCCSEAVKNALALKAARPGARVIVLAKDLRTYGFREVYLQQAREAGVLFVRYPEEEAPEVTGGPELTVRVTRRRHAPRAHAAAGSARAQHRDRSRPRQPEAVGHSADIAHRRRILPRSPPQAPPRGPGERRDLRLRAGALAPVHGRDHRPGQGGRGPGGDHSRAPLPRDSRADRAH